jgi:hypothetical protein
MAKSRSGFREKTMFQRFDAIDFVDTRALSPRDMVLALPRDGFDPLEQMAAAERADWVLLRLVLCAGAATLLLALATTLGR